jgi:hypothetical protein
MNSSDLPGWILRAYKILVSSCQDRPFTIKDAERILEGTDVKTIRIIVSRLNKSGLLISEPSAEDSRIRIYTLLDKQPEDELCDLALFSSRQESDLLTGYLPALQAGSLKRKEKTDSLHISDETAFPCFSEMILPSDFFADRSSPHPFFSFAGDVIKTQEDCDIFIVLIWLKHIQSLDDSPPISFTALLDRESEGFNQFLKKLNRYIRKNNKNEALQSFSLDQFSERLAQWLAKLGQFGRLYIEPAYLEFFDGPPITIRSGPDPSDISPDIFSHVIHTISKNIPGNTSSLDPGTADLMVHLAKPRRSEHIYVPSCGYCELLTATAAYLNLPLSSKRPKSRPQKKDTGPAGTQDLVIAAECFTSSMTKKTGPPPYISGILADLLDIPSLIMKTGDYLRHPKFRDTIGSIGFDLIVSVVPPGLKGYTEELLKEDEAWTRYWFGFPSRRNADWLFIQHITASLNDSGRAVIQIPAQTLIRKGAEGEIRTLFIRKGPIEGVILLSGESGPVVDAQVLLILNRNKPASRADQILCIDATRLKSNTSEPSNHIDRLQSPDESDFSYSRVCSCYQAWKEEPGFSRIVPVSEILDNDGVISIPYLVHGRKPEDRGNDDEWRWKLLSAENHQVFAGTACQTVPDGIYPVLTPQDIDETGHFSVQNMHKVSRIPSSGRVIPCGSVIFSIQEIPAQKHGKKSIPPEWYIDKVTLTGGHMKNLIGGEGVLWIELSDYTILSEYLGLILHLIQHRVRFTGTRDTIIRTGLHIQIPVPPVCQQIQIVKTIWKNEDIRAFFEQMIMIREHQSGIFKS